MESFVALAVGAGLLMVGLAFMRWHVKEWRQEQQDPSLDPADRRHYLARYRRRMQTSGLLILLGVLIPLGDWLIDRNKNPVPATLVWLLILALTVWIILLALSDLFSTRTHSRAALSKVHEQQRELERQLAELRDREGNGQSNGYA